MKKYEKPMVELTKFNATDNIAQWCADAYSTARNR